MDEWLDLPGLPDAALTFQVKGRTSMPSLKAWLPPNPPKSWIKNGLNAKAELEGLKIIAVLLYKSIARMVIIIIIIKKCWSEILHVETQNLQEHIYAYFTFWVKRLRMFLLSWRAWNEMSQSLNVWTRRSDLNIRSKVWRHKFPCRQHYGDVFGFFWHQQAALENLGVLAVVWGVLASDGWYQPTQSSPHPRI